MRGPKDFITGTVDLEQKKASQLKNDIVYAASALFLPATFVVLPS